MRTLHAQSGSYFFLFGTRCGPDWLPRGGFPPPGQSSQDSQPTWKSRTVHPCTTVCRVVSGGGNRCVAVSPCRSRRRKLYPTGRPSLLHDNRWPSLCGRAWASSFCRVEFGIAIARVRNQTSGTCKLPLPTQRPASFGILTT